jgi:hypothetical protein
MKIRVERKQITDTILMIRPANFGYNAETAENNAFQSNEGTMTASEIKSEAIKEFDTFIEVLRSADIEVIVIEDSNNPPKKDAVFPNNWISFHQNGAVVTYPMNAASRRNERREDIIESLEENFVIEKRYSFEVYEEEDQFLEGTGSMIMDRENNIIYACLSPRTDIRLLDKFCVLMGCSKLCFNAVDRNGMQIYHTNVMMAVGEEFAIVCLDSLKDEDEQKELIESLDARGKEIIDITYNQMESYAGNMLNVNSVTGENYIIMSEQAYRSLDDNQIERIESHGRILKSNIDVIEKYGGGGVRCMMAEVFLKKK